MGKLASAKQRALLRALGYTGDLCIDTKEASKKIQYLQHWYGNASDEEYKELVKYESTDERVNEMNLKWQKKQAMIAIATPVIGCVGCSVILWIVLSFFIALLSSC